MRIPNEAECYTLGLSTSQEISVITSPAVKQNINKLKKGGQMSLTFWLTLWVKLSRVLCMSRANCRWCSTSSYFSTATWDTWNKREDHPCSLNIHVLVKQAPPVVHCWLLHWLYRNNPSHWKQGSKKQFNNIFKQNQRCVKTPWPHGGPMQPGLTIWSLFSTSPLPNLFL